MAKSDLSEVRRNWRLLVSATFGCAVGFPTIGFYSIGIFAPAFHRDFGWSQGGVLGGLLLASAAILFGGPAVGGWIDRRGPRAITTISLVLLGLTYMTLAAGNGSLPLYYASWLAISVGGLGAAAISFTRAINSNFRVHRGLALGIVLGGTGLFAFFVKPYASWALGAFGWRGAVLAIGLLPIVVGAPAVWWGFPREWAPDRATVDHPAETGLTLRAAMRTASFWILAFAFIGMAVGVGAPLPNLENILKSHSVAPELVVRVAAVGGLAIFIGRLIGGWLLDRVWAPLLGLALLSGAAIGCFVLSQPHPSTTEAAAAVVLVGLAAGLEYDMLSYLVARYIGVRHYGAVYSLLFGIFAVGAGAGPGLLGHAYDVSGTYTFGLRLCAASLAIAGVVLLLLGRYPINFEGAGADSSAVRRERSRAPNSSHARAQQAAGAYAAERRLGR